MDRAAVEALERATVEAVAPAKLLEIAGWLVPLDDGPISRSKSAVPLDHAAGPEALSDIEAAYWTEGLRPAFRLADFSGLTGVREALAQRGYEGAQPTVVQVGDVARLAAFRDQPGEIMDRPDADWGAVFLGKGFADGERRVAQLARAPDALYGAARENGEIVAVGVVTFGHGWAGLHGLRTVQDRQGRGLASQVMAALGRAAAERGLTKVFLQVEEANPARSLYRKAGFIDAWTYRYWRRPG